VSFFLSFFISDDVYAQQQQKRKGKKEEAATSQKMKAMTNALLLLLLLLLSHVNQINSATTTAVIDSTQLYQNVDISINATSNTVVYTSGTQKGMIQVSGSTGDTIDLQIVSQDANGDDTTQTVSIFFGTITYKYRTAVIGYLGLHGGIVHLRSYSQFGNSQQDAVNTVGKLMSDESIVPSGLTVVVNSSKRKRDFLYDDDDENEFRIVTPVERSNQAKKEKTKGGDSDNNKQHNKRSEFLEEERTKRERLFAQNQKLHPTPKSKVLKDIKNKKESKITGSLAKSVITARILNKGKISLSSGEDEVPLNQAQEEDIAIHYKKSSERAKKLIRDQLIRIKFGLKDDVKIMPDNHYIYRVNKDEWKESHELSEEQRFELRLSGNAAPLMEEFNKDPVFLASIAFDLKRMENALSNSNELVNELRIMMKYSLDRNLTDMHENLNMFHGRGYAKNSFHSNGEVNENDGYYYEGDDESENSDGHNQRSKRYYNDVVGQPSQGDVVDDPNEYPNVAAMITQNGAACADMRPGLVAANSAACTLVSVAILNNYIFGNGGLQSKINALQAAVSTLETTTSELVTTGELTQTQITNYGAALALSQQQIGNLGNAVNSLTIAANTEQLTISLIQQTQARLSFTGNLLQTTTDSNIQQTANALNGQSELVNEQIVSFQNQVNSQFEAFDASIDNDIRAVYVSMASVQAQILNQLNTLATDTGSRMQSLVNSINSQFSIISAVVGDDHASLIRLSNFSITLQSAITELYQQLFFRGTLPVDYFMYKSFVQQSNNGTLMPMVIEGTGNPPPNMTQYTALDGLSMSFTVTSESICGITSQGIAARNAAIQASIMANTILTADVPVGVHPDTLKYSGLTSGVVSIPLENLKLYFISFTLSTLHTVILYYNGTAMMPILDNPTNRLLSGAVRFYFTTDDSTVLSKVAVGDGLMTRMYATVGAFFFKVTYQQASNFNLSPPGFTMTFTQLQALGGNNIASPMQVRMVEAQNSAMITNLLQKAAIYQGDSVLMVPLVSPIFLAPNGLPPINSNPTTLSQILFNNMGFLNTTVVISTAFYNANPQINGTLTTDTPLTAAQTNASISSGFGGAYTDPALSRSKRALPDPQVGTVSSCYSGITIVPNAYSSEVNYMSMSSSSQTKAKQCLAKPGCAYSVIQEPLATQWYTDYFYRGGRSDMFPSAGATSASSPTGSIVCDLNTALTVPIGTGSISPIHSMIIPPSINGIWFGQGGYHISNVISSYNGAQHQCYLNCGAGVSCDSGSGTINGNMTCGAPPFVTGFSVYQVNGNVNVGGTSGMNGLVGQPSLYPGAQCSLNIGIPVWIYYPPALTGGVSQNTWEACLPYDQDAVDETGSSSYKGFSVPYFLTPNDISGAVASTSGGGLGQTLGNAGNTSAAYSPLAGVNLIAYFPPCSLMTVTECLAASTNPSIGMRQGLCTVIIDVTQSTVSPVNIVQVCANVTANPCINITDLYTCMTFTQQNNNTSQAIPVCQWAIAVGNTPASCQPLDPANTASSYSAPNYPATTPQAFYIPCQFRTIALTTNVIYSGTATDWLCVFDALCYAYEASPSSGLLCYPLTKNSTLYLESSSINPIWTNLTTYNSQMTFLNSTLGISFSLCSQPQAQCITRTPRGTNRIQYLMTLMLGINSTSIGLCNNIPVLAGFCQDKYLFYSPTWTGGWSDDTDGSHQADFLVSYCTNYASSCNQKCQLYNHDLNSCMNVPNQGCFISESALTCYQATSDQRAAVCPGSTTTSYAIGSNCVQSGNICTILSASIFLNGTAANYSSGSADEGQNAADAALNHQYLLLSECAMIAGYGYGNMSNAALSARLAGVILPAIMARLCTAVISPTGIVCTQAALVGGCDPTVGPVCDLLTNQDAAFDNAINVQICAPTDSASCVSTTPDNVNFPCGWLYSIVGGTSAGGGTCMPIAQAQSTCLGNSAYGYYDINTFGPSTAITSIQMSGSPQSFVNAGINPTTFLWNTNLTPGPLDVVINGPLGMSCPVGQYPKGFYCCYDTLCTTGTLNMWHPKMVHITTDQSNCVNSSVASFEINTSIPIACMQRTSMLDSTTQFYSCEPFVSSQGALLFPFTNPNERAPQTVAVTSQTDLRTLTPLMTFSPTGSEIGDFRAISPGYTYTYLNTKFEYDLVYDVSISMVNTEAGQYGDINITTVQLNSNLAPSNGVYQLSVMHAPQMVSQFALDITNMLNSKNNIFENNPQAYNVYPDYGTYDYQGPMGADPSGNYIAKSNVLAFAYCSKLYNVPVVEVVASIPNEYSATVTINGVLRPDIPIKVTVQDDYSSNLPRFGEKYVLFYDAINQILYSASNAHIGLNMPGMLGYTYSATLTNNFDFEGIVNPAVNTNWDPRYANIWIDQFSVASSYTPGTASGPAEFCGSLLASSTGQTSQQSQLASVYLGLNYDLLTANDQYLWNQRINATNPGFIAYFINTVQSTAQDLGCTGIIQNQEDPGAATDNYGTWYSQSTITTTQPYSISLPLLAQAMTPFVAGADRAMCGNCVLVKDGTGAFVSSLPGVSDVCNPAYGISFAPNIPVQSNIDVLKAEMLAFCLTASSYEIMDDQPNGRLSMSLNPTLGEITVSIQLNASTSVYVITANSLCVVVSSTNATYSIGSYIMTLVNVLPFTIGYEIRVRLNASHLALPPVSGSNCELDIDSNLGPSQNETIGVSICTGNLLYIQLYDVNGDPCSQVLSASQSLTSEQLNADQAILDKQDAYVNGIFNTSEALAAQLASLDSTLSTNLGLVQITLQNSIFQFNSNITDLGASYASVLAQQNSVADVLVNLDGRITDAHVTLAVINDNVTSIIQTQSEITQNQQQIGEQLSNIQNDLQNVTAESAKVGIIIAINNNLTVQVNGVLANITSQLADIVKLGGGGGLQTTLGSFQGAVNTVTATGVGVIVMAAVGLAASLTAIIMISVKMANDAHSPEVLLAKDFIKMKKEKQAADAREATRRAQQQQQQQQDPTNQGNNDLVSQDDQDGQRLLPRQQRQQGRVQNQNGGDLLGDVARQVGKLAAPGNIRTAENIVKGFV